MSFNLLLAGFSRFTNPRRLQVALRGDALLHDPRFNKGSAFTRRERTEFRLEGKLPYEVNTLEQQKQRAYAQYREHETDISKNGFLQGLKAQSWVLFYALLSTHLEEMFPVIYTPTEAEAISKYSHVFRRSEGLYLSAPSADSMEQDFLDACEGRDLDLIVVSDGEAILGIGDQASLEENGMRDPLQGCGGIGISSAKGVIYTLAAGINPARLLAVTLDVGTNNTDLLQDEMYLGTRAKRLDPNAYDQFVDRFFSLVKQHQPRCLLHCEDFGINNAQRLLGRYRGQHAVFNDDIQGTGAVTLAALQSALKVTGSKLEDQRIVLYGAGTAGLGIVRQLRDAIRITARLSTPEASSRFWLIDKHGLIKSSLGNKIRPEIEHDFIRKEEHWSSDETSLLEVIRHVKPTVIIGTSTQAKAFTQDVIEEMSKHVIRPIIFPLSNPTGLHEISPQDAMEWSKGQALIATGSPFPAVTLPDSQRDYIVAECNNALIYPGLGLGTILSKSNIMTDEMIVAGAERLSELAPAVHDHNRALLPSFKDAAAVNFEIALAVMNRAMEQGVAGIQIDEEKRREYARNAQWKPQYEEYRYDPKVNTIA
ncbi:MAG: NAD-dependent malic enzyme, mitochondrial [Tremellales sp. Tagirdzhanova-0007]|nr:MAG: NAD-dependent malic enzyme, mitochondrial [Tremellales sp. Tagirdzhanova-0007]